MSTQNPDLHIANARAAFTRGDYKQALIESGACLAQAAQSLEARVIRVNCALQLERWREGIADLQILIDISPENPQFRRLLALCWLRIGNASRQASDLQNAADAYENAMRAYPEGQDARYNLAVLLLKSDHRERATELLREVLSAEPQNALAALHLAQGYVESERGAEALPLLNNLVTHSAEKDVLERVAALLATAGDPAAALNLGLKLYRNQPQFYKAGWLLAATLRSHGYLSHANKLLDALDVAENPAGQFHVALARNLGLPIVYALAADIDQARTEYANRLQAFIHAYPASRIAHVKPDPAMFVWENFFLAYQGHDDRSLQETYGRWLNASLGAILPQFSAPLTRPKRSKPRLLMASSFFRQCTVGAYFFSWVEYLARHGWEVLLVQIGKYDDELTRKFAQCCAKLLRIDGPLPRIAMRLRELEADILVYPEIGMEARVVALAAMKLAPIQVCAWGHPVTTGLPSIDAFFSCAEMEPDNAQRHYSETLLTLPGLGTRYLSPTIPPTPTRAELGLPEDRTLYLFPQSPFKLHPDNDGILQELVRGDPDALIVLFNGQTSGMTELLRARLLRSLENVSPAPEKHLHFFPQGNRNDYLRVNVACDVMLDSLHWSGGNTTLDALHCGLPVVTCPGEFMRGRQSMAMLKHLGLDELIARDAHELAKTAISIAHDKTRRERLTTQIRTRLPLLTASEAPLAALDEHLRTLLKQ